MSDADVLRELLEEVLANDADFPAKFYARLFATHPEVRPLFFRSSPDAQQKMFAQKLMLLVDVLDQPDRVPQGTRRREGLSRDLWRHPRDVRVGR